MCVYSVCWISLDPRPPSWEGKPGINCLHVCKITRKHGHHMLSVISSHYSTIYVHLWPQKVQALRGGFSLQSILLKIYRKTYACANNRYQAFPPQGGSLGSRLMLNVIHTVFSQTIATFEMLLHIIMYDFSEVYYRMGLDTALERLLPSKFIVPISTEPRMKQWLEIKSRTFCCGDLL